MSIAYDLTVSRPIIVEHNDAWRETFHDLAAAVRRVVGREALRIDHVGSTSVPGLGAKDVIDIQVTVSSLSTADSWPAQIGPFQRRDIREDHAPPGPSPGADWKKRY